MKDRINSNHIITYAFRYALTRDVCAPVLVTDYIRENIDILEKEDMEMIASEINSYCIGDIDSKWFDLRNWLLNHIIKMCAS